MEILKSCPFEEPVGKYEIENDKPMMTNEEWFCSLTTEEKAKFMCDIYEMGKNRKEYFMRLDKAVEWLKQPHIIER